VAHVGQRALAGAPLDELIAGPWQLRRGCWRSRSQACSSSVRRADAIAARRLGWREGVGGARCCRRTRIALRGMLLRSTGPVVVEDLANDARFGSAPLLRQRAWLSSLSVLVHGRPGRSEILGVHTAQPREFTIHDTPSSRRWPTFWRPRSIAAREEALRRSEDNFRLAHRERADIVTIVGEKACSATPARRWSACSGTRPGAARAQCVRLRPPGDFRSSPRRWRARSTTPGAQAAQFRFRAQGRCRRVLESGRPGARGPRGRRPVIVKRA